MQAACSASYTLLRTSTGASPTGSGAPSEYCSSSCSQSATSSCGAALFSPLSFACCRNLPGVQPYAFLKKSINELSLLKPLRYAVQRKRRDRVHLRGMNRTAFVRGRDRVLSMQTEKQRYACFHRDRNVLAVQYAEVDLFLRHCCLSCHSVLLVSA